MRACSMIQARVVDLQVSCAWVSTRRPGAVVTVVGPDPVGPIASAGKIALLATVAEMVSANRLEAAERLSICRQDRVGGTGVLLQLSVSEATVADLAALTAAVSDNIATNALLRRVGLPAVSAMVADADVRDVTVHDLVRDVRDESVAPAFATGTARGLATLMAAIGSGSWGTPEARALVLTWMSHNTDRGYVSDTLDPDAPVVHLVNKTGTDPGVLVDAGLITGVDEIAYAVVSRWQCTADPQARVAAVAAVRRWGAELIALAAH